MKEGAKVWLGKLTVLDMALKANKQMPEGIQNIFERVASLENVLILIICILQKLLINLI